MVILYQWINFNRYAFVPWSLFFPFYLSTFLLDQWKCSILNAIGLLMIDPDGWVSRVWSKEEKEIWQTNWIKCDDQIQRSRWGCRSVKSVSGFWGPIVMGIFSGIFGWTLDVAQNTGYFIHAFFISHLKLVYRDPCVTLYRIPYFFFSPYPSLPANMFDHRWSQCPGII